MNKVYLIGNLTRDPEISTTTSGISVCRMSIAVGRRFANADGGRDADFFNITAWRGTADNCAKFLKKGNKIAVSGSIQTRTWTDNQNNKRQATEVVVDEAFFVDTKGENSQGSYDEPAFQTTQAPNFEEVASDDDLPF